ncbi:MAG: 16S rRNA (guanine(966)-N(2))-methyltransferase RsmD [Candidatus Izemoplasmatales bacterium]
MLRIVAGQYRGIRLDEVKNIRTRPTTDKNKESLFNMLGQFFEGGKALDLFAGSGSLGFEAYSRGMEQVTFVDDFQLAIDTIEKNKSKLHDAFIEDFVILKRDVFTFLERRSSVEYDLILVDPPYHDTSYERLLTLIEKNGFLAKHGVVVFESDKTKMIDVRMSSLVKIKEKTSGNTKFHIFTKGDLS